MIGGTVLIGVLYLLVNLVYFRALPMATIGASTRIGEEAATASLGPTAGRLLAAAVLVSIFGCLSSAFIAASRLGLPMSEDAPAFRWRARIHPRHHTPTASIVTLGAWSMLLVLTGSYEQLFEYVVFTGIIVHVITGLALFRLRRQRPDTPRPYRVVGYPWVPGLFVVAMTGLLLNTIRERPIRSLARCRSRGPWRALLSMAADAHLRAIGSIGGLPREHGGHSQTQPSARPPRHGAD